MRQFIFSILTCLLAVCSTNVIAKESIPVLLYHQSAKNEVLAGSLDALKQAVREGKRIRIYMNLGFVEHTMDSGFLSIFNGKVYAQINSIQGQRPNRETGIIELMPYAKHVGLYSTDSPYELKWFTY